MPKKSKIQLEEQPLQDYQERAIAKLLEPQSAGAVLAHSTGTGKTRTSIEALKQLGLPTTVVVPAALRANYLKEMKRWYGDELPKDFNIESQQSVARKGLQHDVPGGLLIVDEAHRARDPMSQLMARLRESEAKKKLLLTATPNFNSPKDMSPLVNLAAGKTVLPEDDATFKNKYIGEQEVMPPFLQRMMGVKPGILPALKNKEELGKILKKYVDYQAGRSEGFPSSTEETIKVPMSAGQTDIYKSILGQAPWWVRQKVKWGLPPGKGELESMNAFLGGPRQVSNSTGSFIKDPSKAESPKIQKAVAALREMIRKNPKGKGVVYSNYLDSGLGEYKKMLDKANVPYGEFSGDISPRDRNEMVKQYNADKLKALLISSAGSEGLDLKGTRLLQILEPHFNAEKEKQIIGRAIRYKSHDALKPEDRKVLIQRYMAEPQSGFMARMFGRNTDKGTDEYIRNIAMQKSRLNQEVADLLSNKAPVKPSLFSSLLGGK